jgi:prolyl oligopeptidase
MDMLRFHKYTIGYAWKSNYGCSEDSKEEFDNLVNISPLNNIRVPEGGKYPAVLALTGDHDDRVVPSHTLKYMATLQHTMGSVATQDKPLLVRIDTKAGHGAGTPSSKKIEEVSDMYSFLVQAINLQYR